MAIHGMFHVKHALIPASPYRYIYFPRAALLVVNLAVPPGKVIKVKWDYSPLTKL